MYALRVETAINVLSNVDSGRLRSDEKSEELCGKEEN